MGLCCYLVWWGGVRLWVFVSSVVDVLVDDWVYDYLMFLFAWFAC